MMPSRWVLKVLLGWCVCSFICELGYGSEDDIACLKSIKQTLQDPYNYLQTNWNLNNHTEGFICQFPGVDCWRPDENKVLNIKLPNMGLKGPFPRGLQYCSSITGLDLSSNDLFGPLPDDIDKILPYLTSLELSSNNFYGEIPVEISKMDYLNVLKLDNNQFTGRIPLEIGQLARLKTFSVTNNLLFGPVPSFSNGIVSTESSVFFNANSYANNSGLCGKPLDPCRSTLENKITVIVGAVTGFVTLAVVILVIWVAVYKRRISKKKKKKDVDLITYPASAADLAPVVAPDIQGEDAADLAPNIQGEGAANLAPVVAPDIQGAAVVIGDIVC